MSQVNWLRGASAVLMSGLLLLLAVGCNEGTDFNPGELFSIEDYAQDQDYAFNALWMMTSWHRSLTSAKKYLDTNVEGLSFLESIPPEWTQNDPSDGSLLWNIDGFPDEFQWLDDQWYYRSYQDATFEFVDVNRGVPNDNPLDPAKIGFMELSFQVNPFGDTFGVGDSVSVEYDDDFQNPSVLRGQSMFWNSDVVQASSAPSDLASYASMNNIWGAEITNMSADPNNPQGEYLVTGQTILVRADLLEQATLDIEVEASIRANGRGEATIVVDGETRAEIVFESYDTYFHGYILLRSSGFKERLAF